MGGGDSDSSDPHDGTVIKKRVQGSECGRATKGPRFIRTKARVI